MYFQPTASRSFSRDLTSSSRARQCRCACKACAPARRAIGRIISFHSLGPIGAVLGFFVDRLRPHRAEAPRGAPAAGAEDGGDRTVHRRHRARLQQPARRRDRQSAAARARRRRNADARTQGAHRHACGRARRRSDATAAGVRAPADPRPGGARSRIVSSRP